MTQESTTDTFIITTFKQSGGIDTVKEYLETEYSKYSDKTRSEVPDVNTEDGRKRIKALAAETNKKLSELDSPIRDYLRDIKKQPKLIEAIAKENKTKWTNFRAELLKPLEDAQAEHDAVINWLAGVPAVCGDPGVTSDQLKGFIETINGYTADLVWPELQKKFKVAHENALTTATVTLERIEAAEKQAAELAELREKQAKAEQAERDRLIKEEAAEKATREAEAKAQREKEATERRAVEATQREESAKAATAKAQRDAELAEERRKQEAAEAVERGAQAKIDAQARQNAAVKKAAADELARQVDELEQQEQDAKDRATNKEHRTPINRAAMVALIGVGLSKEDAQKAITAIARKQIPNIVILY